MALDFPSSPTVGQLFPATATPGVPQWAWDGSSWVTPVGVGANQLSACKIQRFTSNGTYTPTPGMAFCVIECVGGGGGGGTAVASSTTVLGGGGGGAGSYARKILTSAQVGASQTITIGAGGASATAGTDTSFGSLCIGKGGGVGGSATTFPGAAGVGGVAGTGDITIPGGMGNSGWWSGSSLNMNGTSGGGGASAFGGGGGSAFSGGGNVATTGNAGSAYGSGGGGGLAQTTTSTAAGGAGAPGIVIVTEFGNWAQPAAVVVRGSIFGLQISAAGGTTSFSITAGSAADSTAVDILTLSGTVTKSTAAWAAGSAVGGLDTGTIANSTFYHVYVIKRVDTGATDVLISLSATAPTLPSPYTLFRRVGALSTGGSGNFQQMSQVGDEFLWGAVQIDYASAAGNSAARQVLALSVPTGVRVWANFILVASSGASQNLLATSLDQTDQAATSAAGGFQVGTTAANDRASCPCSIRTDLNAHIGMRSSGTVSYTVMTYGWIDRRGRDF
jgi:hypothetical protein